MKIWNFPSLPIDLLTSVKWDSLSCNTGSQPTWAPWHLVQVWCKMSQKTCPKIWYRHFYDLGLSALKKKCKRSDCSCGFSKWVYGSEAWLVNVHNFVVSFCACLLYLCFAFSLLLSRWFCFTSKLRRTAFSRFP